MVRAFSLLDGFRQSRLWKKATRLKEYPNSFFSTDGRRARELVPAKQRPLVDIAAEVMADESPTESAFSYTGFCWPRLPHKRLPDEQTWEKKGHQVTPG